MSDATVVHPEPAVRPGSRSRAHAAPDPLLRRIAASETWPVVLVAAFAVLMAVIVMPPPVYSDPFYVFQAAELWPNIPADMPYIHQSMRIGLVLPTRFVQELLGDGQLSFAVASILLGALLPIGTYAVGRALFGRTVGLLAIAILLIHPFFVVVDPYVEVVAWSTGELMPDMPAGGSFALGVAALLAASRSAGRSQLVWLVVAGALFGVAYLIREFIALMFAGIPVLLFVLRIPIRRAAFVAAPMIAVLGLELVHSALVFDHPLARILTAAAHGSDAGPAATTPTAGEVIARFHRAMTMWHPLGVLFLVALVLNVVGWLATRDRRLALTLTWFLALWLPLTLLAGIINPDSPSLRAWIVRYWIPVFPPLLVGALGAIVLIHRRLPSEGARRFAAVGLVAVLMVAYVGPAAAEFTGLRRDHAWSELRAWISGRQDITHLWTDDRTAQTLSFYTRAPGGETIWPGTVSTFASRRPALPDGAKDGPLLLSRFGPRQRPSPAAGWRLLWRSSDGGTLSLWVREAG